MYIDFVVCLGGDGVLLHASYLFKRAIPPVTEAAFLGPNRVRSRPPCVGLPGLLHVQGRLENPHASSRCLKLPCHALAAVHGCLSSVHATSCKDMMQCCCYPTTPECATSCCCLPNVWA